MVIIDYVDPWQIENGDLRVVYALGVKIVILRLKPKYKNYIKLVDDSTPKVSMESFISKPDSPVKIKLT